MNLLRSYEKRTQSLRSWLFDRDNLSLNERRLGEMTRLDPSLPLATDRLREFCEFYRLSEEEALNVASIKDKDALEDMFTDVETDAGLLKNYQDARLLYTARMQLAYNRFPVSWKLMKHLNAGYPPVKRPGIKVLDYGCGVGDYGLSFAVHGYFVTLCDIAGGNLEFARWRFAKRNFNFDTIPVGTDDLYPDLGRHHVILAGEVLEHVRNPLLVLQNMHAALPKGGLLWYSGYPDFQREVGGDHLIEAAEQREECLAFVQKNFRPATQLSLPGCLYRKV